MMEIADDKLKKLITSIIEVGDVYRVKMNPQFGLL